MSRIDAALFFVRIKAGQTFRFYPRQGDDVHAGIDMVCTGPVADVGGEDGRHVPFRYPPDVQVGDRDGAFWRSVADGYEFEIDEGE